MKYRSDCDYINNGVSSQMASPVNGILHVLNCKKGSARIKIKVKRREQLYMYLNQILIGISAYEPRFKRYYKQSSVDLIKYFNELLETHCIDKTFEYKQSYKDKMTIGYYEIILTYSDLIIPN